MTERTATTSRTHAYDAANRLTSVTPAAGSAATLTYDPLGRIATRTVGTSPVQTYRYVGASDLVWQQASTALTTSSIVDPSGSRVGATDGTTGGGAWLLFDLLGSVAGAESGAAESSSAVTTALRYDAYGQTIGTYPSGGSSLPVRYRGLIDLAPTTDTDVAGTGSDPLYAMGARAYSPHLGGFTSLDTVAGSAQDPASMNRYLYAAANPATLIDPTGHGVDCQIGQSCSDEDRQADAERLRRQQARERAARASNTNGGNHSTDTGHDGGDNDTDGSTTSTATTQMAGGAQDPPVFTIDEARFMRAVSIYGDPRLWANSSLRPPCEEWAPDWHCQASRESGVLFIAAMLEMASVFGAGPGAATGGVGVAKASSTSGMLSRLSSAAARLQNWFARTADKPWSASTPTTRGDYMETSKHLLAHLERLGTLLRPRNFKGIDFFNYATGHATSLKSLDVRLRNYEIGARLESRLRGYVRSVAQFDGAVAGKTRVEAGETTSRELLLAISRRPEALTEVQMTALNNVQRYAAGLGVDFRLVYVP